MRQKLTSRFLLFAGPTAGVLVLLAVGCARQSHEAGAEEHGVALERQGRAAVTKTAEPAPEDRYMGPAVASESGDSATDGPAAPAGETAATEAGVGPAPEPKAPGRLAGFVDPLTKSADRIPIALEGCLRRALANNLGIQIARFGPAIADTGVVEAEAMFDPSWFLNNALGRVRQDAGTFLAGAATLVAKQWDLATGVDTLLPTGASISLTQDWTYVDSSSAFFTPNPQYASAIGLILRQPLLRGAGLEVTKSPIVLARFDRSISLSDFRARVMDTLLEVERAYWDLVLAETRVGALSEALDAAKENQRIAKRRFDEGKAKRLILSLADSAVTSRQSDLIVARLQLARTSDRLKRLMNDRELPLEEPTLLQTTEQPMADPIPVGRALLQASMVAAMKARPEMAQADARLAQTGVRERVARNGLLPQLDLAAGYGFTGLDSDVDRAVNEQFETEFFEWSVGLELRVPIGNRSRTAAHERTKLEQEVALREREDTRQRVLLEVSDAVRNLGAAEEAILATRAAREAAEQTLRDQEANVAAGAALVKDLLEAQRDLADAKVREMEAMAGYMLSLASLERAKGTFLAYNNIRIIEDEPEPLEDRRK